MNCRYFLLNQDNSCRDINSHSYLILCWEPYNFIFFPREVFRILNTKKGNLWRCLQSKFMLRMKSSLKANRVVSSDKHKNGGIIPFAVLMDSPRMPQAQTFPKQITL